MNVAWRVLGCLVGSAFLASACGSDDSSPSTSSISDPVALCKAVTAEECKRIYECFKPELRALAQLPATEAECVTQGEAMLGCSTATADKVCAGPAMESLAQGNGCIVQAKAATCAQITNAGANIAAYAPACGQCVPL